ncbi:putative urea ABC transporter substrate-binding protein [Gilvimarinus agarilyticus]|uniref:putative urea ABC transporter substrate-binding protein n=1 Tax=Gilvimarinus sp. 2_MG-2023 TaxID=3062666 RepID=UPI001C095053|nr:putative urea ABC transporter substrate-binding protein [Gilvimarinus sp. 2_MG-2023]MBU2887350.1 putative urea ABC transporter substrate-binding protein [Gilvimarinus agarilyticus]MDO6572009.1 putative urea ABC transporter substrate-binding protein [Gilvimarinus sp. 2_MG-2023]
MLTIFRKSLAGAALGVVAAAPTVYAEQEYKIAWTIYAGTMPLGYAQDHGILEKWGDKYGFDLQAVQLNDYIEAQTQFAAGTFDGSVAITLDALTIPAASGVDTTVVVPMSTSVGSDGIVMRGKNATLADIKGAKVNLVELSGSHYMLARALDRVGMSERDITIVNTSDADIGSIFTDSATEVVATWKPQLSQILQQFSDTALVFDSSDIRGEIVDGLIVHTETLEREPNLGRAIAGAWYETTAMLSPSHPEHDEFIAYMAEQLNTSSDDLRSQLSTIEFFNAEQGLKYVTSDALGQTMNSITEFAFQHGLLGESAPDASFIGIETGSGAILGNDTNVKLRFNAEWLTEIAQ